MGDISLPAADPRGKAMAIGRLKRWVESLAFVRWGSEGDSDGVYLSPIIDLMTPIPLSSLPCTKQSNTGAYTIS